MEATMSESDQLIDLRDNLLAASDKLLDERNAAAAAGEKDKVRVAEEEFDRIAIVLATVQFAINQNRAMNMDAVAKRLQDIVQAQRAVGLSSTLKDLGALAARVREPAAGEVRPPFKPGPIPPGIDGLFLSKAPDIMRRLMKDFGFTDVQAAGILGNIGHECAGFRLMQEVKPVGGGRGGFGWVQWTGSRRRAFEAFCAEKGLEPTSDDANYGFLDRELRTSEKATVPAVRATASLEAAVEAFERKFERAGVVAIASRIKWAQKALNAFQK
jgi:hypothetical protein